MATSRTRTTPSTVSAPRQRTSSGSSQVTTQLEVPNIRTSIMDVTPAMAAEWLKANISNRRPHDRTISLYASDMEAGRWQLNGEAIQIADDGTLLNGQHRLLAIIRSGVTVKMLVIEGLPRETQATMDAGRKRTHVDNFTLEGERNAKAIAAIARRVALWQRTPPDRGFRGVVSFGEARETLERHPEIRRSAEMADRVHRGFRPLSVSVLGTAHFLMNQKSPEETPWFFAAIESGAKLDEGDPVLTLRERVRSDRDAGIKVDDVRALGYMVRAWNAYRERRTLARLVHPKGEPVPEIL